MKERIWLSPPHMGVKEIKNIQEIFESNWITTVGSNLDGFEADICKYNSVKHAVALSSGTAALHLALVTLGIERNDEVICSSFTFSASANPIIYQGATPVFIDSDQESWNMSPEFLEKAIKDRISKNKKPKAIILVHLYGLAARMGEIMRIAEQYEIPIIEDAAESLGTTYKGKMTGSMGSIGIFSFNGNKIITTSGGGALVSNDSKIAEKSRYLASQAREPAPHYEHTEIGFNYRMSNVLAGIGRGQMEVLPERIKKRRSNFEYYQKHLKNIPEISFCPELADTFSNRWLSCMLIDKLSPVDRESLRLALEKENIEARPLWKPMHLQPVFKNYPYYGNGVSDSFFDQGLCLPSGSNLSDEDLERVVSIIQNKFR